MPLSPLDFMTVRPPNAPNYAAPLVGPMLMQGIGGLPQDYFQGQQNQRTLELQKPVIDPATGKPTTDIQQVLQAAAERGGLEYALKTLPISLQQQILRSMPNLSSEVGAPPATTPNPPAASGPANITGPQSQAAPTGATAAAGDTLRSLFRGDSAAIGKVSSRVGIDPDTPLTQLTPEQTSTVANYFQAWQNSKGRTASAANTTPSEGGGSSEEPSSPQSSPSAPSETNQGASYGLAEERNRAPSSPAPFMGGATSGAPAPLGGGPETPSPASGIMPNGPAPARPGAPQGGPAQAMAGQAQPMGALPGFPGNVSPGSAAAAVQPTRVAQAGPPTAQPTAQPPKAGRGAAGLVPPGWEGRELQYAAQQHQLASQLRNYAARMGVLGMQTKPIEDQASAADARASRIEDVLKPTTLEQNIESGALDREGEIKATRARSEATYKGLRGLEQQANNDAPYHQSAKSILNDPQMYSGIGADRVLNWNRIKAAFGDTQGALLQEALQKVTAQTVLGSINAQRDEMSEAGAGTSGGRLFQQQVALVNQAAPKLEGTLAGNRFLNEVSIRTAELARVHAQMAREYRRTHNNLLDDGFDEKLSKYITSHPFLTEQEQSRIDLLGAPTPPPGAVGDKGKLAAWTTGMGLRSGDYVRVPGTEPPRYKVVP